MDIKVNITTFSWGLQNLQFSEAKSIKLTERVRKTGKSNALLFC